MTDISKTDGIRELTNEEIAAVVGGLNNTGPLSCIIHQVQTIICKVERLLSCFGNQTQT